MIKKITIFILILCLIPLSTWIRIKGDEIEEEKKQNPDKYFKIEFTEFSCISCHRYPVLYHTDKDYCQKRESLHNSHKDIYSYFFTYVNGITICSLCSAFIFEIPLEDINIAIDKNLLAVKKNESFYPASLSGNEKQLVQSILKAKTFQYFDISYINNLTDLEKENLYLKMDNFLMGINYDIADIIYKKLYKHEYIKKKEFPYVI